MHSNSLPKVLLITSNKQRHLYVAHQISQSMPVVGIICESKQEAGQGESDRSINRDDIEVIQNHFDSLEKTEQAYFGRAVSFPAANVLFQERGQVNQQASLDWIQEWDPDLILLYGCSIIRPPLLNLYKDRVINMHLGLSPYYRGSATNFWPLVNRQPECVGVTIHIATQKVDAGAILYQARPTPSLYDTAHDLGCKSIVVGAARFVQAALDHYRGDSQLVPQVGQGQVCYTKDFSAEAVRTMWRNFEDGMIVDLVENYTAKTRQFPIVECY